MPASGSLGQKRSWAVPGCTAELCSSERLGWDRLQGVRVGAVIAIELELDRRTSKPHHPAPSGDLPTLQDTSPLRTRQASPSSRSGVARLSRMEPECRAPRSARSASTRRESQGPPIMAADELRTIRGGVRRCRLAGVLVQERSGRACGVQLAPGVPHQAVRDVEHPAAARRDGRDPSARHSPKPDFGRRRLTGWRHQSARQDNHKCNAEPEADGMLR